MNVYCLHCPTDQNHPSAAGPIRNHGSFYRSSDKVYVKRWRCMKCRRTFSLATGDPSFKSKTRQFNQAFYDQMTSTNSLRRAARTTGLHRDTLARKVKSLGRLAEAHLLDNNRQQPLATQVQIDDLITIEHTKMKPLSVFVVITDKRRILSIGVASMPANNTLAKRSVLKYGPRADERPEVRRRCLQETLPLIEAKASFSSDKDPSYPQIVRDVFPLALHQTHKGRVARDQGQGELKKGPFDPLWALNHTFGKSRADTNRLIRRTWCTTKKAVRLHRHLYLFAHSHNQFLETGLKPKVPSYHPFRDGRWMVPERPQQTSRPATSVRGRSPRRRARV